MHIVVTLLVIFSAWKWADWGKWKLFHATMVYFALGNMTYNFICDDYLLWKLVPDQFSSDLLTELLYTCIIFPGTALLFLSRYPDQRKKKIQHFLFWIIIYAGFEWIYCIFGHISYDHGWGLIFSAAFDCMMFPMLRLHYRKPVGAYILSVFIAFFLIRLFHVPVRLFPG